jgi:molybdate transport system substrate-binding protein
LLELLFEFLGLVDRLLFKSRPVRIVTRDGNQDRCPLSGSRHARIARVSLLRSIWSQDLRGRKEAAREVVEDVVEDKVMNYLRIATAAFALVAVMLAGGTADAAEIRVLASGSLKAALSKLLPDFQKSSGNLATIEYGPAGAIVGRIEKNDAADVVIVSRSQLQKLESNGKVVPGSRVDIAGIALGVAIRKGAPAPDISNVEAFKRTLLAARSIGYRDPATGSTSGIYTAGMLERLGIAQDLKPKLRLDSSEGDAPENVFKAVANGEIEMQIGQITEIVIAPGVDLAGPLPSEVQNTTVMAAGIVTAGKAQDTAKALIAFISSPSAVAVLKATGFQPVDRN